MEEEIGDKKGGFGKESYRIGFDDRQLGEPWKMRQVLSQGQGNG
jgi:hypothetical protein